MLTFQNHLSCYINTQYTWGDLCLLCYYILREKLSFESLCLASTILLSVCFGLIHCAVFLLSNNSTSSHILLKPLQIVDTQWEKTHAGIQPSTYTNIHRRQTVSCLMSLPQHLSLCTCKVHRLSFVWARWRMNGSDMHNSLCPIVLWLQMYYNK